jgi:hypothetical protein
VSWEACPWPHPVDLKDENGDFITYEEPFRDRDGNSLPGCGVICFRKDIEYPDNHPYWEWMDEYHQGERQYMCPGPKYSAACSIWIADKAGPASHASCDEECYCQCHYGHCICPDPDKGVTPEALAIVCTIHGHVYSKITTAGLQ